MDQPLIPSIQATKTRNRIEPRKSLDYVPKNKKRNREFEKIHSDGYTEKVGNLMKDSRERCILPCCKAKLKTNNSCMILFIFI